MSDRCDRQLERDAAQGDEAAQQQLIRHRLRAGGRDPRRNPWIRDVVRQPRHGANVERWDEREVVSCVDASLWFGAIRCRCMRLFELGVTVLPVHWRRTEASREVLGHWGFGVHVAGTCSLKAWRGWAIRGEVVLVAEARVRQGYPARAV